MNKNLTIINTVLILAVLTGLGGLGNFWLASPSPDRIAEPTPTAAPKDFQETKVERKSENRRFASQVIQNNLFRKQRTEYQAPPSPLGQVTQAMPDQEKPPTVSLRGVILLNGSKIAILEGTQPTNPSKTKTLPIKRKGYKIGDSVGSYRISAIDINSVTLNAPTGEISKIKVTKRSPAQMVQQTGNKLFHKGDASYLTRGFSKAPQNKSQRRAASQIKTPPSRASRVQQPRTRSPSTRVPQIPVIKSNPRLNQNSPIQPPLGNFQIPGMPQTKP